MINVFYMLRKCFKVQRGYLSYNRKCLRRAKCSNDVQFSSVNEKGWERERERERERDFNKVVFLSYISNNPLTDNAVL